MGSKNEVQDVAATKETKGATTFQFSLKPLIFLLNFYGFWIPIGDRIEPNRCISRYTKRGLPIVLLFGGLFLVVNFTFCIFASTITANVALKNHANKSFINVTAMQIFDRVLNFFNIAAFTIAIHLIFFIRVWLFPGTWNRLWINLQQIQNDLNLDQEFYGRIRKYVYISLSAFVIDSAFFIYPVSFGPIWYWELNYPYAIFVVGLNFTRHIVTSILVFYLILVLCAVELFSVLNERIKSLIVQNKSVDLASELEKLRDHHTLVCQFTRWINNCYGLMILLTIGHGCLAFIAQSYAILNTFKSTDSTHELKFLQLGVFFHDFMRLSAFICIPKKLKDQVVAASHLNLISDIHFEINFLFLK